MQKPETLPLKLKLPEQKRPLMANAKLRKAVASLQQGKRPHEGTQQRMKAMFKASGEWLWMVQEKIESDPIQELKYGYELKDTSKVVATSEKYKHDFTRRMTKKECFLYLLLVEQTRLKAEQEAKLEVLKEEAKPSLIVTP